MKQTLETCRDMRPDDDGYLAHMKVGAEISKTVFTAALRADENVLRKQKNDVVALALELMRRPDLTIEHEPHLVQRSETSLA